jgi:integrase
MSSLHQAAADYLSLRRALGFKLAGHDQLLSDRIEHLEGRGAPTLTTDLALGWAMQSAGRVMPLRRMDVARGFARYLRTLDPTTEVPPAGLLPRQVGRVTPYLYSEADIRSLMAAAGTLRPALRAQTYRTLIGLLAVSGMRIGEALALDRGDVDLNRGLVTVRAGSSARPGSFRCTPRRSPCSATTHARAITDGSTPARRRSSYPRPVPG